MATKKSGTGRTSLPQVGKSKITSSGSTNGNAGRTPSSKAAVKITTTNTEKLPKLPSPTTKAVPSTTKQLGALQNGLDSTDRNITSEVVVAENDVDAEKVAQEREMEAAKKLAEEAEAEKAAAEKAVIMAAKLAAEAEVIRVAEAEEANKRLRANGEVTLIYEQYNELFPIANGSTTHANIDEVYCLSFVMPNCLIHLSNHKPDVKRKLEIEGDLDLFIPEEPRGQYLSLEAGKTYYVYVEQESAQLARDQERMRRIAEGMDGARASTEQRAEGCSCLYGNPCVDQYICKDWDNRFAVAKKNGWKGF